MIHKTNVFMVMTDYQLQLAIAAIREYHQFETNIVLFLYRKTNLIKLINKNSKIYKIYPLYAHEIYRKPRILYGLFNELLRLINHFRSILILSNTKIDKVYLSIEEEHFVALVSWISKYNKELKIIHLEEGNVVHTDPDSNKDITINESRLIKSVKKLRAQVRKLYFGENELKNKIGETYGRASFYEYAVVLSNKNLSNKLFGKNHLQLNHMLFLETLKELFDFNSPAILKLSESSNTIILIVTDGRSDNDTSDTEPYKRLLVQMNNYFKSNGYQVLMKHHPLESSYLNNLKLSVTVLDENLPAEYYFIKLKERLIVIGGDSTSLGVSKTLGIPTLSYLELLGDNLVTSQRNNRFLSAFDIPLINELSDVINYSET